MKEIQWNNYFLAQYLYLVFSSKYKYLKILTPRDIYLRSKILCCIQRHNSESFMAKANKQMVLKNDFFFVFDLSFNFFIPVAKMLFINILCNIYQVA